MAGTRGPWIRRFEADLDNIYQKVLGVTFILVLQLYNVIFCIHMSHVFQSTIDTDSDSGEVSTALFRNRDPQIHFPMKIKISG